MKNDIKISGASLSGLEITDATQVSPTSPILRLKSPTVICKNAFWQWISAQIKDTRKI